MSPHVNRSAVADLCVYVGEESVLMCIWLWRTEVKTDAFLDCSLPYGAHQFSQNGWPVGPRSLVPDSPVLMLHVYVNMPDFTSFSWQFILLYGWIMLRFLLFAHQLMDRHLGCVHILSLVNNNTLIMDSQVFRIKFRSGFVLQHIHIIYSLSSCTDAQLSHSLRF